MSPSNIKYTLANLLQPVLSDLTIEALVTANRGLKICLFHRSMKTFHVLIAVHLVLAACHVLKAVRHFGRHKEVCKLFTTTVAVKVVGCQLRHVKLNTCAGTCRSEQTYNSKSCECCSPIKKKPVDVELHCVKPGTKGPAYRYRYKVHEHEYCSCLRCLDH